MNKKEREEIKELMLEYTIASQVIRDAWLPKDIPVDVDLLASLREYCDELAHELKVKLKNEL